MKGEKRHVSANITQGYRSYTGRRKTVLQVEREWREEFIYFSWWTGFMMTRTATRFPPKAGAKA
jgi:hypothetical protein